MLWVLPDPKGHGGPAATPSLGPPGPQQAEDKLLLCLTGYRHQQKNKVPARVHSTGKVHKPFPGLSPPTAKELHLLKFLHTLPLPSPAHLGQVQYEHFQV